MTTLAAPAAHGADPLSVSLIGFAVAACYLLSRTSSDPHLSPLPRHRSPADRAGRPGRDACRRCRGIGRIRRLGAVAVHRFWWSAVGDRCMACRNASPFLPSAAGDGIGNPRWCKNPTTCPLVCKRGTYPFR